MRRLTSPARLIAIAALLVALGAILTTNVPTTSGQIPLYSAYGSGLTQFDQVGIYAGGRICGTVSADKDGKWALGIQLSSPCAPSDGNEITFEHNGKFVVQTATWKPGGSVTDDGYDKTAGVLFSLPGEPLPTAPVAATPTPTPTPSTAPAAQTSVASGIAPKPPAGGITQVVAGTTDIQALVDIQTFTVESVLKWDLAGQKFLFFIVGGPTFANSLATLAATDIVSIKAK